MVSVVIPCYNASPFIAATLESVLTQTFADFEIVVVDDGSPDVVAFEAAVAPYRDRIVYLSQSNTGPSGARNAGIRRARGEYIALLDSDDEWCPDYLARQVAVLQARGADLVYADGLIVGGPLDGRSLMAVTPSHVSVTLERLIAEECVVLTSCTLVRREALFAAGLFDDRFRRAEDAHLWLRLALQGKTITWHPETLVRHRRRSGSLSDDGPAMLQAYIDVLEDLDHRFEFSAAQRALIRRQIARRRAWIAAEHGKRLFLAGRFREAASALDAARRAEPARRSQVRLGLLQAGVRVAPRLMRRAYEWMRPAAVAR